MKSFLVEPHNIIYPSLHIKLGFSKNLVEAMDLNGQDFLYLKRLFPRLSERKLKEETIIGPDIKIINDFNFVTTLNTE